jgi:uncharacterized membrane protein
MGEHIQQALQHAGLPPWLVVAVLAAMPVSEVRGAIPAGLALHLSLWQIIPIVVPCSVLPTIPILLWFEPVAAFLSDKPVIGGLVRWVLKKARKREDLVRRYGVFALTLFAAVPLPMFGTWTGAPIAVVFGMKFGRSLACLFLGACIQTALVVLACLGVLGIGRLCGAG